MHNVNLEFKTYTPGDVDGNGEIDLLDVVTLSQYVAEWQNLTVVTEATNPDGIGGADLSDVVHLAQYVAEWQGIELH